MIEVSNLVKSFDGFKALDDATLKVEKGSVYGLMGPNGAGKSTLIRHLLGVYKQDAGTVKIDGCDIWENISIKSRIGAIPDDWFYFPQATVKEMKNYYKGIYPTFDNDKYVKLMEVFGIDEKKNIKYLSKGMQKQVAFWLTLCTNPDYLILDEPVDGLDPIMRRRVWSLIMEDVAERGTTVLVSSHNLRELEDVCDHVGIMNKGKIILERSLSELQDNLVKLQVAFKEGQAADLSKFPVLHQSSIGRVSTLIVRMSPKKALEAMSQYEPLICEALPLTLEEIFIYELGGVDNELKENIF